MGKFLDQCCNDAWDITRGRKKVVGNKIVEVAAEDTTVTEEETEYGWLSPDGTFYPVEFANHQKWAFTYIMSLYKAKKISIDDLGEAHRNQHVGDWLINKGWVLIHKPNLLQTLTKITRNPVIRLTKKQKEFLYNYLNAKGRTEEANKILDD